MHKSHKKHRQTNTKTEDKKIKIEKKATARNDEKWGVCKKNGHKSVKKGGLE